MAQTLNDFYISQGKVLPSITERSKLYESFGLGSASDYLTSAQAGTNASMNASLLAKLQTQPTNVGEQIKQISTQVPKIQEQINALNLTNVNPVPDLNNLPSVDTKLIDTGYNNAITTSELLKQQIEKQKADEEALKQSLITQGATGTTISEMYASLATKRPIADVQAKLTAEQEEYGVPDLLSKLQTQNIKLATLQGNITRMDTQYLNEVANIEAQPIVQGIQEQQINKIARQYNSDRAYKVAEMAAEAAVAQAYQGNLTAANGLVADAVNAYTFDIQQQRSDFDNLFNLHGDWVNSLEASDKQILTDARDNLKTQEANIREDKTNVLNIMLKYPNAGITITDTVDNATKKATDWQATQIEAPTPTEVGVIPKATDYTWNDLKLNLLTIPASPAMRTTMAYQKEAILAFAYASSGKQMSWNEAKQLYSAYIPEILDSNETKVNKLLSLESAINSIISTAKGESLTQGKIAQQKMNSIKTDLEIEKKPVSTIVGYESSGQTSTAVIKGQNISIMQPDGSIWQINANGTYTRIK